MLEIFHSGVHRETAVHRRTIGAVAFMALAVLVFSGCRLVGQGQLQVVNDESGLGANDTVVRAFAREPGDAWPPPGEAAILITGTDFGTPPDYGMDGELYFVNSTMAMCPTAGAGPHVFNIRGQAINIIGTVAVSDGNVHQWLTMPFLYPQPMRRYLSWALIDTEPLPGSNGDHLIRRCGTMTWVDE